MMCGGLKHKFTSDDHQNNRFVGTTFHTTLAGWSKCIPSGKFVADCQKPQLQVLGFAKKPGDEVQMPVFLRPIFITIKSPFKLTFRDAAVVG
jgi:hypothetical protein